MSFKYTSKSDDHVVTHVQFQGPKVNFVFMSRVSEELNRGAFALSTAAHQRPVFCFTTNVRFVVCRNRFVPLVQPLAFSCSSSDELSVVVQLPHTMYCTALTKECCSLHGEPLQRPSLCSWKCLGGHFRPGSFFYDCFSL